ncbi:hypothetical protein ACQRBN_03210 [Bariatricus sp. SGI.154]|uniref:hypothetical protein n=1 Tax=Bariatricus sp. SGI.154 TaxID=3420549 RepID=UPI003D082B8E
MYEECQVTLRMERMILKDGYFDEKIHHCKIITYHPEEESIYLLSEDTELPAFSLDGIYECRIETKDGTIGCKGCIRERYWNKRGKVMKYQIKNGFYKNLVN